MRWVLLVLVGCASRDVAAVDEIYAHHDGDRVLCGLGVDDASISVDEIEAGMRRARDRDEVMILFAHDPGVTIAPARIQMILDAADRVGLPFRTFPELPGTTGAGLALGFDDYYVSDWLQLRDSIRAHPVTFFVSNYGDLDSTDRAALHDLARDGHAIEAHGMGHRDAMVYVDEHGLTRYLADEIDPMLAAMASDGLFPTTFAYPYGSRTEEIDAALLTRFTLLRSLTYVDRGMLSSAPCPR